MAVTRTAASFVLQPRVHAERDDRRDRGLFALLAGGTSDALGEIYDRHAASLFRHALALARNASDAEDLVQTTFVKLATTGAPLVGVSRPKSYLHRILRSAWIDVARRRAVAAEEPIGAEPPGESARFADESIDIRRAMETLAERQREAVVLHLFNGFSFREIGGITGVPTFTAASRYRLAIDRLRQLLGYER